MQEQQIKWWLQWLAEKIRAMRWQEQWQWNPLVLFCKQQWLWWPCSPECIKAALQQWWQLAELAKQAQANCW